MSEQDHIMKLWVSLKLLMGDNGGATLREWFEKIPLTDLKIAHEMVDILTVTSGVVLTGRGEE